MEINQLPIFWMARSVRQLLLKVSALAVLGASWLALFLWAFLLTEEALRYWTAQLHQHAAADWLLALADANFTVYGPATCLLLFSITLYFYRAPRMRSALKLPLEFATAIVLFLLCHLVIFYSLSDPANPRWITPFTDTGVAAVEPSLVLSQPGLFLTGLLLGLLYWFQGSGRFRLYWRNLRRVVRQAVNP